MDYEGNAKKRKRSPSPNTAGNTSSTSGGEFEAFLSLCGKDTRHTFTDFLYTSLVGARIHTFRDDNELRVGEKIGSEPLKAINESKISIPIFSENYASSKWCLRELSQMVECQKSMGQKILPIFFDVEPSDVRHQRGIYDQAFRQHEEHVDEKTVQEWKEALKKVGELKGLELKKETNGHQGKLASQVTLKVLLELKKNNKNVPENLFGMDRHVEEMMTRLNVHSSDVQIVGILGMGGIGKTTIAKVIFNQLSERFSEGCSFIANVRERSKHNDLVKMQKELCSNILKGENLKEIYNVDEGLNIIKNRVCTKEVLIILDDVDTFDQFDKLAGKREWFASGSRIIVTTRDKHVLNQIKVDSTYEPPPMESNHSLQLFSKHAFRGDFPPKEYDTLCRDFLPIAAGLPLALEIIGSYLCDKEKSKWPGILKKFKEIPHKDVQKKLKISYDTLDRGQRQIFLDIACFFIRKDKRDAVYMWDVCKFYPEDGIDALVLRSLVKIDDGDILWMHDQLRDLGRNIVREENFDEPWNRSRVWSPEDALEIMKRCKVTQKDEVFKVEALCIESALFMKYYFSFPKKEFGFLKNLRYLRVDEFDGIEKKIGYLKLDFPKLRWLEWQGFSCPYEKIKFHLESLVILHLSGWSEVERKLWNQIKMAKNLRVRNLMHFLSGSIKTPDFSPFAALEILIINNCSVFDEIDPSIGNLTSLRVLYISECSFITELPATSGNLTSLRVLHISGSSIKELPATIGNLEKLEEIYARKCGDLRIEFPDAIKRLSSLRILDFSSTTISALPSSICGLTRLQTLDLSFARLARLQRLPELPSSLTSLNVSSTLIETFPSLAYFDRLVEIPRDIEKLSELEILNFSRASISTLPAEIGDLPRLKILIVGSENLQYIQRLPSSLIKLDISGSKSMERLPDLSNLKSLKSFDLSDCRSLQRLPDLSNLGMLKRLDLSYCCKLADVEGLRFLKSLEVLNLSYCVSLQRMPDLSNLKKLKELQRKRIGWIKMQFQDEELELPCTTEVDTRSIETGFEFSN